MTELRNIGLSVLDTDITKYLDERSPFRVRNGVTQCYLWMAMLISGRFSQHLIPSPILARLYTLLDDGMQGYYEALLIRTTPFPYPFTQIINIGLVLVMVFVPVLVHSMSPNFIWAALISVCCAFGFFALAQVASELEDPFGTDYYDHPLENWQIDFDLELMDLLNRVNFDVPRSVVDIPSAGTDGVETNTTASHTRGLSASSLTRSNLQKQRHFTKAAQHCLQLEEVADDDDHAIVGGRRTQTIRELSNRNSVGNGRNMGPEMSLNNGVVPFRSVSRNDSQSPENSVGDFHIAHDPFSNLPGATLPERTPPTGRSPAAGQQHLVASPAGGQQHLGGSHLAGHHSKLESSLRSNLPASARASLKNANTIESVVPEKTPKLIADDTPKSSPAPGKPASSLLKKASSKTEEEQESTRGQENEEKTKCGMGKTVPTGGNVHQYFNFGENAGATLLPPVNSGTDNVSVLSPSLRTGSKSTEIIDPAEKDADTLSGSPEVINIENDSIKSQERDAAGTSNLVRATSQDANRKAPASDREGLTTNAPSTNRSESIVDAGGVSPRSKDANITLPRSTGPNSLVNSRAADVTSPVTDLDVLS